MIYFVKNSYSAKAILQTNLVLKQIFAR